MEKQQFLTTSGRNFSTKILSKRGLNLRTAALVEKNTKLIRSLMQLHVSFHELASDKMSDE